MSIPRSTANYRCLFGVSDEPPPASPTPTRRFPVEHGWLRRDGTVFRDESGAIWSWRGMSAFLAFYRFLCGEDITPVLDQYQDVCGANILRVFCMVGWDTLSPRFLPQGFAQYWAQLETFIALCAARGLRLELTIFADAQIVMPTERDQRDFAGRVAEIAHRWWNVCLETCNEPFKNGVDVERVVPPPGRALRASGRYDLPDATIGAPGPNLTLPHLDYVTVHTERKDEWPRTGKDLQELREGWGPGTNATGQPFRGLTGVGCPVVSDEPMGADEDNEPGRRSNVPDDFLAHAACCALMGAGGTFHSTDGLNAVLLRPRQLACAVAFFSAFLFVPPEAQIAPYQRGDQNSEAGVGNMPMRHDDRTSLRTFCKAVGGVEYCLAIRPTADWQAIGRDGWQVVDQPARGLVKLTR